MQYRIFGMYDNRYSKKYKTCFTSVFVGLVMQYQLW